MWLLNILPKKMFKEYLEELWSFDDMPNFQFFE